MEKTEHGSVISLYHSSLFSNESLKIHLEKVGTLATYKLVAVHIMYKISPHWQYHIRPNNQ